MSCNQWWQYNLVILLNISRKDDHIEKKNNLKTQNNSLPIHVQASQDIRVTDLILKKFHSVVLLSRRDPEKLILRRALQALFNFRTWPPEDAPTIQQWSVLGSSVISFLNRGVPEFQPFLTGKALQPLGWIRSGLLEMQWPELSSIPNKATRQYWLLHSQPLSWYSLTQILPFQHTGLALSLSSDSASSGHLKLGPFFVPIALALRILCHIAAHSPSLCRSSMELFAASLGFHHPNVVLSAKLATPLPTLTSWSLMSKLNSPSPHSSPCRTPLWKMPTGSYSLLPVI